MTVKLAAYRLEQLEARIARLKTRAEAAEKLVGELDEALEEAINILAYCGNIEDASRLARARQRGEPGV
jgi:hypothetical protein